MFYDCQGQVYYVRYSIDGQPSVSIPANDVKYGLSSSPIRTSLYYCLPLTGLSEGLHTISVSAEGLFYYWRSSDMIHNTVVGNSSKIQFYLYSNQYSWGGSTSPPEGAVSPKITILSPNSEVYTSNEVALSFKTNISNDTPILTDIWYQISGQPNSTSVYHLNNISQTNLFNNNLTGLPEGNNTITVYAKATGGFSKDGVFYVYEIVGSSSVNFLLDALFPKISFALAQNKTYESANLVLNFSVNKPVSQIIYSLDNQSNLTSNSNVSLVLDNLGNGDHNVTVYSQDEYGLVSAPNTVYFSVKVSPKIPILTISLIVVVVAIIVMAGLLVYFKKHKQ